MINQNINFNYSYLALGDSYTVGENVMETDAFPAILANKLHQRKLQINAPLIIAKTGFTTGELLNEIESKNIQESFSIVTLLIGVNNQYRNYSQETYREEFSLLLNKAIAFADGNRQRVFVYSIPDWSVTPFAAEKNIDVNKVASEIDEFNAINKNETLKLGVTYFDVTPLTRKPAFKGSFLADDQLHYSRKMYEQWVDLSIDKIYESLVL